MRSPGSEPRPASTLVLVRDGTQGLEVLLTVRPRHFRFMGGATVFPGGAVAPADLDPRWVDASARSPAEAVADLGEVDEANALGWYVCALREAYEEVGYLSAEGPVESIGRDFADDPERFRRRCLELGVVLATDRLTAAGRWVTPLGSPVRFDTRFFLAVAPAGWDPSPDPSEVAACGWRAPSEALRELAEGKAIMAPPTIDVLQRLERFGTAAEAIGSVVGGSLGGAATVLAARLSLKVQMVIAPNPGLMTGPGTNTYVVGDGPTWVIDPAVDDPSYIDAVANSAGDVVAILVTHRHPDHTGGAAALVARTEAPVLAFGEAPAGGVPVTRLEDGDVLELPGATLKAMHAPGHAGDHLCFFLEEERSLFAGDNVLGEGTPVISPPDGDMRAYLATLRRLSTLGARRIYPGHFRPLADEKVWTRYLAHRAEREDMILAALVPKSATLEEIVASAYGDTPAELHPLALRTALAHLEMLEEDGKVGRRGRLWRVDT